MIWGALWHSKGDTPNHLIRENLFPVLLKTKKECQEWIKERYGYLKTRPHLRRAPHHWRMPRPVKVKLTYEGQVDDA